jgi:phosphate-selective porin OprO and OprP
MPGGSHTILRGRRMRLAQQSFFVFLFFLVVTAISNFTSAQDPAPKQVDSPAVIQSLERRIQDLEETIRRMQVGGMRVIGAAETLPQTALPDRIGSVTADGTEPGQLGPAGSKDQSTSQDVSGSERKTAVAGWDNGFFLRSSDRCFNLRITGQIQADYRTFLDDVDFVDIDSFFLRRARFGIEADLLGVYEFRFLPDFGQGRTQIQDSYINVHYWDFFQVEAGKFKQPFSYEQLIQDRYVPTLERSLIDQLVPARDIGVMIHGQKLFCNRLDYAVAVSNGGINSDGDTNDRKDLAGRVVVRPFNCEACWPILHGLQFGISGTIGVEEEPANPSTLRTPATVPWFQFNSTVRADGRRDRWSPEIAYFFRSFGMAAQYFHEDQRFRPAFTGPASNIVQEVPFKGFYVLASYLVTGETRTTYSEPVIPIRNFNPCYPFYGTGAWELLARVSRLTVGDEVFATGLAQLADPTQSSDGATELTVGFNWYLNPWVRTQFNWEHTWIDELVRLGPGAGGLLGHQDTLMARFQIIF